MEDVVSGFWKDRNVFVSGASGLLGSALTETLYARGANVVALMRDWTPASLLVSSGLARRITLVHGELQDYEVMLRALNEYEIDTVFHLGAQTIVGTAARSALSTFESNIRGTWTLLEAAREAGADQQAGGRPVAHERDDVGAPGVERLRQGGAQQPGSARDEDVPVLPEAAHHIFHGASPLAHSFSRRSRSRSVSIGCQKPACRYAMSWPSAASRSSTSRSRIASSPPM